MRMPAILWFRADLRLADNPALLAAAADGRPVLPVYIHDRAAMGERAPGGASRWWLHHALAALGHALAARGAPLHLAEGRAEEVLPRLLAETGATEIHAAGLSGPWERAQSKRVAATAPLSLHRGQLLHHPDEVRTGQGRFYQVYTPFSRALFELLRGLPPPLPAPGRLAGLAAPGSLPLAALRLLPQPPEPDWAAGFAAQGTPGEAGALARLAAFRPAGYDAARNDPGAEATSGLSPHLRWGEVSPRQVWHAALAWPEGADRTTFLKEILWREFAHHLLWHRPEMPDTALREEFRAFPWEPDARMLRAWQRGRTGYPIVDAGMRQLWQTGWMHNRVRMIVASFLTKHLLQPWQAGERWFWDCLVDADLGSNTASWQWVAGCGADAAPYFRVFNPVLQGEKFDPSGRYVRRWVPELARLSDRLIHRPWDAPGGAASYPPPVIAHGDGRERALAAFARLRAA
jgi:deoxyribodipyrimidine photo-lyase